MAPRKRPRRVSLMQTTRMEAALDAMGPYGFHEDLVLKKLKELLDVYGEDHWFFIEENSYKVLIEAILEQVEEEERKRDEAIYGSSSGILPLPYSDTEDLNIVLPSNEAVDPASDMDDNCLPALVTYKSDANDHLPPSGQESGLQGITFDRSSGKRPMMNDFETGEMNLGGVHNLENTKLSSSHANPSQQPMDGLPTRRRRPYHGWISDGEEEPVLVGLEPAPLPPEIAKLLFGRETHRKHEE